VSEALDEQAARNFLTAMHVGDVCAGIVAEISRSPVASVTLDGFPEHPLGMIGSLDLSWKHFSRHQLKVGQRINAEVMAIDLDAGEAILSMAATENPELWAFLKSIRHGVILSGTIAAIERFGVFVALDDGPAHPVFPGAGFITIPELSWSRFDAPSDVVQVGQRVSCEFLVFDTSNGEARLSLRATQPDPFQTFAERIVVGQKLRGRVTHLLPFGVLVQVADGVEGIIRRQERARTPIKAPQDLLRVGQDITVVATEVDRQQRKLALAVRQ
jgi:small subunit ribosomal protein S1